MNEVALFRGGAATQMMSPEQRAAAIRARAKALKEGGMAYTPFEGGIQYIKVDGNTGTMTYGRDDTEVPLGQRFAVPFDACEHGIIKWSGGKVQDRKMIRYLEGPVPPVPHGEPRVGTLPKPNERDGWNEVISIRMVGLGGEMDKVEVEADCNNESKRQQAMDLLGEMTNMADTAHGEKGFFNAVVVIEVDSYWNKAYSRDVFFPRFRIVGFTDGFTILELGTMADEPDNDPLG